MILFKSPDRLQKSVSFCRRCYGNRVAERLNVLKNLKFMVILAALGILPVLPASAGGVMAGEKNIQVIKTQWFDIIYPPGSSRSAAVLAAKADGIYREVAGQFRTGPWFRIPVVITPAPDEFNGYFSIYPYNHIVLFDTVPTESMAVFSDTILSVFRHELAHAVTYTMKNKFWQTVGTFMGDIYNPAVLTVTTAFAEGASVTAESTAGEGRLNDQYSRQMILQAKVEGLFPGWADIQGAKDKYPAGSESYYFGAAFAHWLQETYGMEKYAQYWYRAVNLKSLTYFTAFSKVYGLKIETAWTQFRNSVRVPDIPADPLSEQGYGDLFAQPGTSGEPAGSRAKENDRGSLYRSLTGSRTGIAWLDKTSSSVWYSGFSDGRYGKPEKILTRYDISRISLSRDGNFLAVSFTDAAGAVSRNRVGVYDIKRKKWSVLQEKGLRDAAIIQTATTYYVAAVVTHSQYADIKFYKFEGNLRRITATGKIIHNQYQAQSFSLTDCGNGRLAFIYKDNMIWTVRVCTIEDGTVGEYSLPYKHAVIRNLSCSSGIGKTELLFSYTGPDTLPRLGRLQLLENDAVFFLQQTDVSGGIYYPVPFGAQIAYIGTFYRDSRLLTVDPGRLQFEKNPAGYRLLPAAAKETEPDATQIHLPSEPEKYNPLAYYTKGSIIPLAGAASKVISDGELESVSLPVLGLTYVSSNPWTTALFTATAGYDLLRNSVLGSAALAGGTATSLFSYQLQGQTEFDRRGYKQAYASATADSELPLGNITSVTLAGTAVAFEGRQSLAELPADSRKQVETVSDFAGLYENPDKTSYIYTGNKFSAGISTLHSSGPGTYETTGCSVTGTYMIHYSGKTESSFDRPALYQNLSAETSFHLPGLLPVTCTYGKTYNLPAALSLTLFPSSSYFLSGNTAIVLYSAEIQKGIPGIAALYCNRITLQTGYAGNFSYGTAGSWDFLKMPELTDKFLSGSMNYYDTVNLTGILTLTPNIGTFARSSFRFNLSAAVLYRIHPADSRSKWNVRISGGLDL